MKSKHTLFLFSLVILTSFSMLISNSAPLIVVTGTVTKSGTPVNDLDVIVKNAKRGQEGKGTTGEAGKGIYSIVFLDFSGGSAGEVGDVLKIQVKENGQVIKEVEYILTKPDIESSKVTVNIEIEKTLPPYDVNADGIVDISDLVLVGQRFGEENPAVGDVNTDGIVDISDLVLVGKHFGEITKNL